MKAWLCRKGFTLWNGSMVNKVDGTHGIYIVKSGNKARKIAR